MTPEHILNVFEEQVKNIKATSSKNMQSVRVTRARGVYGFLRRAGFSESRLDEIWDKHVD